MRPRTAVVAAVVLAVLAGLVVVGPGGPAADGELVELWVGDTATAIGGNHHAPAAGRIGSEAMVFAPVSGRAGTRNCALVALDGATGTER